jgi:hypothetical protein
MRRPYCLREALNSRQIPSRHTLGAERPLKGSQMKKLVFAAGIAAMLVSTVFAQQTPPAASTSQTAAQQPEITPPAHPLTLEQTRELFNIAGTQTMLRALAHQALAVQRANAPEFIPASIWAELEDGLVKIDFPTLLYPTYSKYLSEQDAAKAIEFYKTPEGQHLIQVMPAVMKDAGKIGQEQGTRIAQEVFSRHQQEILDAKAKYDAQRKKEMDEMTNPAPPSESSKPAAH